MADSVLIVGLSTGPIFGCPDTEYGAGQSLETNPVVSEVKTLSNGKGEVIAAAYVPGEHTATYSAKIKGAIPNDSPGTPLTIGEEKGFLKSIKITKTGGDFADISIEISWWNNVKPETTTSGTTGT